MKKRWGATALAVALAGLAISGCITPAENRSPTAVFVASPTAVNVGQQVVFDAQNSTDRDGKITRYHWDFGDLTEDSGVSVVHVYRQGGNYTAILTVTDNGGKKDRSNVTIHVNEYPKAKLDLSTPEAKVLAPVGFSAHNSTDADGTIAACRWEFGDGTNGTGMQTTHAYQEPGTFTVNLTVTDDFGACDSRSTDITVVLRTFSITWEIVPGSAPQISDYSQENTTINKSVPLAFTNMTGTEFRLSWRDDIPHLLLGAYNDEFGMMVVDPDNNTQFLESLGGNITLNFTLADPPAELTITARTEAEAEAQVGSKYLKFVGTGTWNVSVVLGEAGGAQGILPNDLDLGNNWKLDVTYYQYELRVTEK